MMLKRVILPRSIIFLMMATILFLPSCRSRPSSEDSFVKSESAATETKIKMSYRNLYGNLVFKSLDKQAEAVDAFEVFNKEKDKVALTLVKMIRSIKEATPSFAHPSAISVDIGAPLSNGAAAYVDLGESEFFIPLVFFNSFFGTNLTGESTRGDMDKVIADKDGIPYDNKYFIQILTHEYAHLLYFSNIKIQRVIDQNNSVQLRSSQRPVLFKTALEHLFGRPIAADLSDIDEAFIEAHVSAAFTKFKAMRKKYFNIRPGLNSITPALERLVNDFSALTDRTGVVFPQAIMAVTESSFSEMVKANLRRNLEVIAVLKANEHIKSSDLIGLLDSSANEFFADFVQVVIDSDEFRFGPNAAKHAGWFPNGGYPFHRYSIDDQSRYRNFNDENDAYSNIGSWTAGDPHFVYSPTASFIGTKFHGRSLTPAEKIKLIRAMFDVLTAEVGRHIASETFEGASLSSADGTQLRVEKIRQYNEELIAKIGPKIDEILGSGNE